MPITSVAAPLVLERWQIASSKQAPAEKHRASGKVNMPDLYHFRGVGVSFCSRHVLSVIEDEAALLADIRFALRGLDPWPPEGGARPSEDHARRVLDHLRLCGWRISPPVPSSAHGTP